MYSACCFSLCRKSAGACRLLFRTDSWVDFLVGNDFLTSVSDFLSEGAICLSEDFKSKPPSLVSFANLEVNCPGTDSCIPEMLALFLGLPIKVDSEKDFDSKDALGATIFENQAQ